MNYSFSVLLFLLIISNAFSQNKNIVPPILSSKEEQGMFENAEAQFSDENYTLALPFFLKLSDKYPQNAYLKYKTGICYLYKSDVPEKSLEYLKKAAEYGYSENDLYFNLGRAMHLNYLFDEAIAEFNRYIGLKPGKKQEQEAQHYIEYCKTAREFVAKPVNVKISNIGKTINTEWSEYVPVISSDEAMLIYTYRGNKSTGGLQNASNVKDSSRQYYEDIFFSRKIGDRWTEPSDIGENINTKEHDAAIALSADGQKLFIFKSTEKDGGDIYMSHLEGTQWSKPAPLDKNINTKYWEGSCSLSSDEKTLYFSSERPGGLGGKDIYSAERQPDGTWGNVKNLGASVNTLYDEDAPFIHPDGTVLLFSSKGHNSMGGFDIFRTYVQKDNTWSKPENAGFPLNTVDEDIYYVISADGARGYFSSGRAGGNGMQDIYSANPGIVGKKSVLISLKGTVTLDDLPVKAEVVVAYADENRNQGVYNSNSATGKYLVNIPTGRDYKIIFKVPGVKEEQVKSLSATNIDFFLEATIDVSFYTSEAIAQRAKNKLHILDEEGGVFKTATQTRDRSFIFNYLPPYENILFKLEGENIEFTDSLRIIVTGVPQTILRGRDSYFHLQESLTDDMKLSALSDNLTLEKIIKKFGTYKAEGLVFKVQIGAYFVAHNFNYSQIKHLGTVDWKNYEDGITRFTMGSFETLGEAAAFREKIVAASTQNTDAFISAQYKGERILLKDLAAKNFYNPR